MLNADPVNPVKAPRDPGTRDFAVLGGAGGRFVGWGPVLSVRDQTDKQKLHPKKKGKTPPTFLFRCGFKKRVLVENGAIFLLFRPLVHPTGAVCTEKT